jgi:hypothetical protein
LVLALLIVMATIAVVHLVAGLRPMYTVLVSVGIGYPLTKVVLWGVPKRGDKSREGLLLRMETVHMWVALVAGMLLVLRFGVSVPWLWSIAAACGSGGLGFTLDRRRRMGTKDSTP